MKFGAWAARVRVESVEVWLIGFRLTWVLVIGRFCKTYRALFSHVASICPPVGTVMITA